MFEQSGISWSLAVAIPLGRSCVAALYHQSYRYCWWSCQILLPTLSSLLVVGMVNVWQQYNTLSVWVMVLTFNCCGSSVYILVCILYSINDVSSWFHEFRLRSSFSCLLVVPSFQVTKRLLYLCVYQCIFKLLVFKNFGSGAHSAVCWWHWRFRSDAKLQFSRIIYYVLCLKILYAYGVICLRHKLERPCMGMMYISQRNALIVTELCIVQILTNLE